MPAKTLPDQATSVVRNDTLPLPNEHCAKLAAIEDFRHDSLISQPVEEGVRYD